jgi:multiple sugar transport system substrate-binding protein
MVQIIYQDWRTEWFPPMAREMLKIFRSSHPQIQVLYAVDPPSETFGEKMIADFQSGTAPDVFQGSGSYFPSWAQNGFTLDLRPYVASDLDLSVISDWDPAQYGSFFTADGKQYGLPKYHGSLALYYNKDLFDAYQIGYPDGSWTHDEYLAAMKSLTKDRDGDGKTDLWGSMIDISWERIQVHVNAWGGHFSDPKDPKRCLMASPPSLQALEWLRARMWDDRVMATPMDVGKMGTSAAFLAGKLAMVEDGSWALRSILEGAKFRVGIAPMPAGPARRATLATTDGFGIYARTGHPKEAWELMRFLIGKDYGRAMAKEQFLQPARASLVGEWAGFIKGEFPGKTEDADIAAFADGQRKGYSVIGESFPNMAAATRIAGTAWEQILVLGKSSVDIMKTAGRDIEAAQAGAK